MQIYVCEKKDTYIFNRLLLDNYSLAILENAALNTTEFDQRSTNLCIYGLVSLCPKCQLNVTLTQSKNDEVVANKTISGNEDFYLKRLRTWQSVKLEFNSSSSFPGSVKLKITTVANENNNTNMWWAIDKLRFCEQNGK